MSESKAKRLLTSSVVALSLATPMASALTPVTSVLAEDADATTKSTTVDKLQEATEARDIAHKDYVDATVDYKLAKDVKESTESAKEKADQALKDAEKVTSDAEKIVVDSTKAIVDAQKVVVDQTEVIEKAENRIENIKNVKELATQKLEEAKAEKADADKKIADANKVIDAQKAIIETAKKAIEVATASKNEPTEDIKQFKKLLAAAQEDLKNAIDASEKDKADGNVKTFETAIKQAQAKIDEADKIIEDAKKSISDSNKEIDVQNKIVTDQTKISNTQANMISDQEKAIRDNTDLIAEQNAKISDAKSKISNAEQIIKTSTEAKEKAESTIETNASVIASAKEAVSTTTKLANDANEVFESAKTRMEKAEKTLHVSQAAVDALRAESVKDQVGGSTETPKDNSETTETPTVEEVKSGHVEFVTESGSHVDTISFDIKKLEELAKAGQEMGVANTTVKSILDSEVEKYQGMVGKSDSVITLTPGAYNVVEVSSTFENGEYVIKAVVKEVSKSDEETPKSDETTTTTSGSTTTTSGSTTTTSGSTTTTSGSTTTTSGSTTTTSGSTTTTQQAEQPKGQTSADGILTNIVFSKSSSGKVAISGKIDKNKLESDQKLEGEFATLTVSNAEGTEIGKYSIANDYTFVGELSSEPKEGDKLIINYGGKTYEIEYTLDSTKDLSGTQQSVSNTTTGSSADTKTNVKASLLPSTGQRNLLGMTIAGISLMIAGAVALFMKFRKKGSSE
jgi:LPXTG-motif cell wall-anchored protein